MLLPFLLAAVDVPQHDAATRARSYDVLIRRIDHYVGQTARAPLTDVADMPAFSKWPVFVLVGPGSFSVAEAVAYELQNHARATIVGERTGGGANPSVSMDLESDFAVIMPIGRFRARLGDRGISWNGIGVSPDIAVPADQAETAALRAIG